ncbi:DUF4352 domain-containing protein [Streptomyces sp. NPDC057927]
MRAYIRRAVVPAVLLSALAVGCSSGGDSKADPKPSASAEPVVDAASKEPSEAPSSSAPATPAIGVGGSSTYAAVDSSDASVKTQMQVTFKTAEFTTPLKLDTSNSPKNGRYVLVTLTVKNVGSAAGNFASYGAMKWQDETTAAQDCTTLESSGSVDLDTTYQPGQSLTGSIVLDVPRDGGTVSYFDAPGDPSFTIRMPKSA